MRRTKIIATVGPASDAPAILDGLITAGTDVFRLNFSHGTHEGHARVFRAIRDRAARAGRRLAIMQDLSGPKMRTGRLAGGVPLQLREGQRLPLVAGDFDGSADRVPINTPELAAAVKPGDRLLLDDGRIELVVEASEGDAIVTRVLGRGPLGERKGINAPGVAIPLAAVTPKDAADLRFGLELGVDLVAVSFVQTSADIERARDLLTQADARVPIVAKIERPVAVEQIDAILAVADAVMVARGDLGIELPIEQVPRIQKEIVTRARRRGVPVIVATQVLESMRTEPRPTRAEVSDAANAVGEGVDAVMLTGETAVGAYPVQAVQTLANVIGAAEAMPPLDVPLALDSDWHGRALSEAAVTLARAARADAIVAVTRAGRTARMLAALRPPVPVFAATADEAVARRLAMLWGIVPLVGRIDPDVDSTCLAVGTRLVHEGRLRPGATVAFVRVHPDLARSDANYLQLQRLGG